MIWLKCIFGLLILKTITCSIETSHENNIRIKRQVAGGIIDKNPKDPKYVVLAKLALKKYDNASGQYLVLQVVKATEQVVAGLLTTIDFYALPLPPFKAQNGNPYNILSCHAKIVEKAWLHKKKVISVNCH